MNHGILCSHHSPHLQSNLSRNRWIGDNAAIQASLLYEHTKLHSVYATARNSQVTFSTKECTNVDEADNNAFLLFVSQKQS